MNIYFEKKNETKQINLVIKYICQKLYDASTMFQCDLLTENDSLRNWLFEDFHWEILISAKYSTHVIIKLHVDDQRNMQKHS